MSEPPLDAHDTLAPLPIHPPSTEVEEPVTQQLRILMTHLGDSAGGNSVPNRLASGIQKWDPSRFSFTKFSSGALRRHQHADVLHLYWPEWLLVRNKGQIALRASALRRLSEFAVLKRQGTKILWTANNIVPHEVDSGGLTERYYRKVAGICDFVVSPSQTVLDEFQLRYPTIVDKPQRVVPLGHYESSYPMSGLSREEARQRLGLPEQAQVLLSFGAIRPYKNIPQLIRAFESLSDDCPVLLVAGKPYNQHLENEIRAAALDATSRGAKVSLHLRFIPDEEVELFFRASNCAVISTSFALASGSALLSVSMGTPVLMPRRGSAFELQANCGSAWVSLFEGGIRHDVLRQALQIRQPASTPDLEKWYSWERACRSYADAYKTAVSVEP